MLPRGLCRLLAAAAVLVLALLVGPVLAGHAHAAGPGQVDRGCGKCTLAVAALVAAEPPQLVAGLGPGGKVPVPQDSRAAGPLGIAATPSRAPPAFAS